MRLLDFPIIKFTLFFIVGIVIASFFHIPLRIILYACIGLTLLLLITFLIGKHQMSKTIWFGIITCLTMICIGTLTVNIHNQRAHQSHYSKNIPVENDSSRMIQFRVREVLKSTAFHDKYVVDILKMDNKKVTGKLLLNIQKDSLSQPLEVDDVLLTKSILSEINKPLNPYQFDYNKYLKRQYIDHQLSLTPYELLKISSEAHTLYGYAASIRSSIDEKLKQYNFEKDELAIIDALLLGQRKDISQDTYNNYVNAGAIHILAVSGLHIGIIFLLLNWILRPIEWLKHGNYIKIVVIALLLWCFAIIAGLSPSVTRAVSMFTIVAIGMNLRRPSNIYNTLAISMFVILLFIPRFLFEVGFQMSYLAVISIVSIQPLFKKLWSPRNIILNYFWGIFTVTLAAQIGVTPISLFYFHQFPGLFFISNLVVIPLLTLNLFFGVLTILLALLNLLPQWLAHSFGLCISIMNDFVSWVSHQEAFIFRNISFGILFLVVTYLSVISLCIYFKKPNYSRFVLVFISILIVQCAFIFERYKNNTDEFIIFQKSRNTLIGIKNGDKLRIASTLDSLRASQDNVIKNYIVGSSISDIDTIELTSVYEFNQEKLLIVDTLGVYNAKTFKPEYILLRNSPKINLNRLIDSLEPKHIIADGSNYKSYVSRWKATCAAKKIPFHSTYEKGAFMAIK